MGVGYIGMLCLGGFVGGFLVLGLDDTTGMENWQKVVSTSFAAAFSGVLFAFIQLIGRDKIGEAMFMYPVGPPLAMLWYYGRDAGKNMASPDPATKLLGWGHMALLLGLSGVAVALSLFPTFRSVL